MTSIYRILDANINRATEGLRTLEEFARFVIEKGTLSHQLKQLRHTLIEATSCLNRTKLLESRDTPGDIGMNLKTASELERPTIASVVLAASQRVQQSLRCLEEYGKVIDSEMASRIEKIRYQSYDLFSKLELAASSLTKKINVSKAKLYVLVDCTLPIHDFIERLKAISEAGVDWIQIRDKATSTNQLVEYSSAAIQALDPFRTQVLINDRLDIAMAVGAAGVHLGQEDLSLADAKKIAPPELWIGVSTHTLDQALQVQSQGADYIGCGPTFSSNTKSFEKYNGVGWLKQIASQVTIPAFAIGGINSSNVNEIIQTGIQRVAIGGAIWNAKNPGNATAEIRKPLNLAPSRTLFK